MLLPLLAGCVCIVVAFLAWWFLGRQSGGGGNSNAAKASDASVASVTNVTSPQKIVMQAPKPAGPPARVEEMPTIAPEPWSEYALLNFAFEHRLLGPGIAPDATTKMTRVTAAEDSYKMVRCTLANGYSVKWMNRYLTVNPDGTLLWNDRKDEPGSCFALEPGFCGGDGKEFIMMRSLLNNRFLRVDGYTNKLVCMDSPSSDNAAQFCWKLQPSQPARRRCGQYYDPDYGRVVNIPCDIVQDPPEGGTCADVTPGFMSKCCLKHNDKSCRNVVLREVVGRGINEAALYIKTRFPDHTIVKCGRGDPCEKMNPFPIHQADTWVLPYDKRLGTVSFPAYRFV